MIGAIYPLATIRARVEAARARQTARFAVGAGLPAGSTSVRDGTKPAPAAGLTANADTPALAPKRPGSRKPERAPGSRDSAGASVGPTQVRDYPGPLGRQARAGCSVDETGRQLLGAVMQRLRPGR